MEKLSLLQEGDVVGIFGVNGWSRVGLVGVGERDGGVRRGKKLVIGRRVGGKR